MLYTRSKVPDIQGYIDLKTEDGIVHVELCTRGLGIGQYTAKITIIKEGSYHENLETKIKSLV